MQRIRVVGTSGSGKTHLARQLAAILDLPHLELDALQHLPGWQPAPLDLFHSRLQEFLTADDAGGWVIVRLSTPAQTRCGSTVCLASNVDLARPPTDRLRMGARADPRLHRLVHRRRQPHPEDRHRAFAEHADAPAVGGDDLPRDVQPEADAAVSAGV